MAYGSMAPGFQMQAPPLMANPVQDQGMKLLQAALNQNKGGGGSPATPGLLAPGGGVASMMNGGMGNGLLSKLFPQTPPGPTSLAPPAPGAGPIDPNTGLPVTQDVLNGAAAAPMPDMGGAGPAPTAMTGLW